ncbi:MAG: lipid-A-disaccharide synthase [Desulfobacterales bacterium]|nr:lipid-A-disaccharide synthase [Desulfobacterales bacterium]
MTNEVMIVAGEASGDLHGAQLVTSMKILDPSLNFCGMGGCELQKAGVEILFEAGKIAVVGLVEVVSHLKDIISAQITLRRRLTQTKPKLLILIDFPDFNLLLARKAKRLGIPVFYYVSPQVWAWRSGRVRTIARLVDKIGVILPFEEQFYRDRGVDAHYVGHPLLDSVHRTLSLDQFSQIHTIESQKKIIGVLPGSRIKEVKRLLPVFLEASRLIQQKSDEGLVFLVLRASTIAEQTLLDFGVENSRAQLDIRIISENQYDMMAACDVAIAASGTVTLELLLLNIPMVAAYKLSPRTYQFGKFLVKVRYFSLVNLIANDAIIPELLQDEANPARIASELCTLLYNKEIRHQMQKRFDHVREQLGRPGASQRAARLALNLIDEHKSPRDG